jgi:sortase A
MKSAIRRDRLILAAAAIVGCTLWQYPAAAVWVGDLANSAQVRSYERELSEVDDEQSKELLKQAKIYNKHLSTGTGNPVDYHLQLASSDNSAMARVTVPRVGVDVLVFHDADEATLKRGAGHLASTSLPVGGASTHAVIADHANARGRSAFAKLNKVEPGDVIVVDVAGEKLQYSIDLITVVDPENVGEFAISPDADLITLVTCTPIGVNSHRLLVRGSRVVSEAPLLATTVATVDAPWFAAWWAGGVGFAAFLALPRRAGLEAQPAQSLRA